jgi:hypothetical protein
VKLGVPGKVGQRRFSVRSRVRSSWVMRAEPVDRVVVAEPRYRTP